jgi:hypothetical protein
MEMVNTRLSPKALFFPSPKTMLEYSLDEAMTTTTSEGGSQRLFTAGYSGNAPL